MCRLSGQEEVQCINSLRELRRCRDSLVSPSQTSSCLFLFTVPCARHADAHVRTCVRGCPVVWGEVEAMQPRLKPIFSTCRWAKPLTILVGTSERLLESKCCFIFKSAALLEDTDKRKACFLGAVSRLKELEGV